MKAMPLARAAAAVAAIVAASGLVESQMRTQLYVTGLTSAITMVQDPTDPNVQFVVQQRGRIRTIQNGTLLAADFLDLTGIVSASGAERGLLGLAFHPDYAKNGFFFVNYTDIPSPGHTRVVRYARSVGNPLVADPGSAYPILSVAQPAENHNGGTLRFGPLDRYLYVGMGDGGGGFDPGNRAQTLTNQLLGKMLRIDVDADAFPSDPDRNYAIPPTNPFVGLPGDDDIWSCGLRNPWKFSFDDPVFLGTGAMVIADVGQQAWEEWNYEPPLAAGRNYGWRMREGYASTGLGGWNGIPLSDPKWAYPHAGAASITGGYVYRGTKLGEHFGRYFWSDFMQNRVWSARLKVDAGSGEAANVMASDVIDHTADLGIPPGNVSSFDVDSNGELYLVHVSGQIYRILPENQAWPVDIAGRFGDELAAGGVRHLLAADSKEVVVSQTFVAETADENEGSVTIGFQTDMAALAFVDVTVICRIPDPVPGPSFVRVSLKNWSSGAFEAIGVRNAGVTPQTLSFLDVPAAAYRRADGRIEALVTGWKPGGLASDPLFMDYDQVRIAPR